MGSRFEDQLNIVLNALKEQNNELQVSSSFDWEDWEDLSFAERKVQLEGSKIINFPRTKLDPAIMEREEK